MRQKTAVFYLLSGITLPLLLCLHLLRPGTALETAGTMESRPLLILMYHSVLRDPGRAGSYVVPPETVASDLAYLQARGYTCILPSEAIAFCRGMGSLPEKPLLLTFDDGHMNNLTYVLPILEELDGKALINVVGSYTEQYSAHPDPNPNYAYLSWAQIQDLRASGRVEIGNHTYNLHCCSPREGVLRLPEEDAAAYRNFLTKDLCLMEALLAERSLSSGVFAYPFGAMDSESAGLVRDLGFSMTLTCKEKISVLQAGAPESLLNLGRFNRPAGPSSQAFFAEILKDA